MPALMAGGCLVGGLRDGEPLEHGNLKIWRHIGRAVGAEAITLRVLECGAGTSPGLRNRDCDEVLYVLQGEGTIFWMASRTASRRIPESTFGRESVCPSKTRDLSP